MATQMCSFGKLSQLGRTAKTTAITRAAVRETGVSRHHGGPIEGPSTSEYYRTEGPKRRPQLEPHYA